MKFTHDRKTISGLFGPTSAVARRLKRVWLVDDDAAFRELMMNLLAKSDGIECDHGFGSAELLLFSLARETPPHTILLDVNLRDRNGIDFIQPIKALAPATRVFMFTTFFDPEHAKRALRSGAAGFLLKSASIEEILDRITQSQFQERMHVDERG